MKVTTLALLNFSGLSYHESDLNHIRFSPMNFFYYAQGKPSLMYFLNDFHKQIANLELASFFGKKIEKKCLFFFFLCQLRLLSSAVLHTI